MRNLIVPAALMASLALGSAAFAATPAAATKPAAAAHMSKTDKHAKTAACEQSWKDQKTHSGSEKDFVKSCVAKG
jgi:hypothetical protein